MDSATKNPWVCLPSVAPFVLPEDAPYISAFNESRTVFADDWIHTGRMPEPRLGPLGAPVMLLQLNASYHGPTKKIPLTLEEIRAGLSDLAAGRPRVERDLLQKKNEDPARRR